MEDQWLSWWPVLLILSRAQHVLWVTVALQIAVKKSVKGTQMSWKDVSSEKVPFRCTGLFSGFRSLSKSRASICDCRLSGQIAAQVFTIWSWISVHLLSVRDCSKTFRPLLNIVEACHGENCDSGQTVASIVNKANFFRWTRAKRSLNSSQTVQGQLWEPYRSSIDRFCSEIKCVESTQIRFGSWFIR
jgi:hypothetical protein